MYRDRQLEHQLSTAVQRYTTRRQDAHTLTHPPVYTLLARVATGSAAIETRSPGADLDVCVVTSLPKGMYILGAKGVSSDYLPPPAYRDSSYDVTSYDICRLALNLTENTHTANIVLRQLMLQNPAYWADLEAYAASVRDWGVLGYNFASYSYGMALAASAPHASDLKKQSRLLTAVYAYATSLLCRKVANDNYPYLPTTMIDCHHACVAGVEGYALASFNIDRLLEHHRRGMVDMSILAPLREELRRQLHKTYRDLTLPYESVVKCARFLQTTKYVQDAPSQGWPQ